MITGASPDPIMMDYGTFIMNPVSFNLFVKIGLSRHLGESTFIKGALGVTVTIGARLLT